MKFIITGISTSQHMFVFYFALLDPVLTKMLLSKDEYLSTGGYPNNLLTKAFQEFRNKELETIFIHTRFIYFMKKISLTFHCFTVLACKDPSNSNCRGLKLQFSNNFGPKLANLSLKKCHKSRNINYFMAKDF